MIRTFRALGRVLRVAVFLAAFSLRMRARKPAEDSAEFEGWRRDYFGGACRGILDRLRIRVLHEGSFPAEGGILVTNHLGYIDVFVLASLGPTVFVSRADVEHWPVIGPLTRWCSTIYIDRERPDQIPQVIEQMSESLSTGAQVVFFPEGTSGAGDLVMPFRASLFGVAAESDAPVRVAALTYQTLPEDPPARDSVCWWGDAGFARHFLGLAGLREIEARVRFGDSVMRSNDRKELAKRCHAEITELFTPVTGSERPR